MSNRTATTVMEAIERAHLGQRTALTCPAHDDETPSLSIGPGDTQPVVFHCHANCSPEDIISAAGLEWGDVSAELEAKEKVDNWTPNGTASHVYPYYLHDGTLSYEVLRVPTGDGKKRFFQRRPNPDAERDGKKWVWNLTDTIRVPYRLPQVIDAVQRGATIHIAEGEKCVHALLNAIPEGDEATCNSGGAGKFLAEYAAWFAGATIVIYADSDEPGRDHAHQVREILLEEGCSVRILEAPPARMHTGRTVGDVADHLSLGYGLDSMLETTPESESTKARTAVDILEILKRPKVEFDFVIDKTLARAERLLLVGIEGHGKSELSRQIAVCTAAGVHPFSSDPMPPKRVLMIDGENHPMQAQHSWKRLFEVTARLGHEIEPGMLNVLEEWDSEIDLLNARGARWLMERVHAYRPDLLVIGPLTNLCGQNLSNYEAVDGLRRTVNKVRTISECAVVMEHHAPLRQQGDKKREMRPYGNGLFLKWPDFGYAMDTVEGRQGTYEFRRFRGDRVRNRHWPEAIRWGAPGDLPWVETMIS